MGGHPAAQRDLTGHRDIAAHRNARHHRDDGGSHADAGGRTVLRRRAFRHVDMDIARVEQRRLDAEIDGPAADVEAAAEIDSFITSLRLPVTIILPLPGIITPSMVSSSPPTSVQARPVTPPT